MKTFLYAIIISIFAFSISHAYIAYGPGSSKRTELVKISEDAKVLKKYCLDGVKEINRKIDNISK